MPRISFTNRTRRLVAAGLLSSLVLAAACGSESTDEARAAVDRQPAPAPVVSDDAPRSPALPVPPPPAPPPVALPPPRAASGGYGLEPVATTFESGQATLALRITDPSGAVVRDYDVVHDKQLHLIIASHDLRHYQHVHPTLDHEGVWTVAVDLPAGGQYRAYADFRPTGGAPTVATADLTVSGPSDPGDAAALQREVTVDGLDIELVGNLVSDSDTIVTVAVTRAGAPVELERYLGAGGHLVDIHAGSLGYTHVHPLDDHLDHDVAFHLRSPRPGRHRLFFDFQVDGVVRTAAFTVDVVPGDPDASTLESGPGGGSLTIGRRAVARAPATAGWLLALADGS